jgi:hypothetical protein
MMALTPLARTHRCSSIQWARDLFPRVSRTVRTGLAADAIAVALIENLHCLQGKQPQHATRNDWYMALAYTSRLGPESEIFPLWWRSIYLRK